MGTKWEQEYQSGIRMGIKIPKWDKNGNKVTRILKSKVGQKWEQSGNKNAKIGQKWE